MTATDVRTAARAEAFNNHYSHKQVRDRYDADLLITGFVDGAVWGAALVTPTREQVSKVLFAHAISDNAGDYSVEIGDQCDSAADAVLALMSGVPGDGT